MSILAEQPALSPLAAVRGRRNGMRWSWLGMALFAIAGIGAPAAQASGSDTNPAASAEHQLPPEVFDVIWEWVSFTTPKEEIVVPEPENYTIELTEEGAVGLQVDCNRGFSQFTLSEDKGITFGPIGITMMLCPDDVLGPRFTSELERVGSYFLMDGDFFLELPMDSGTFRFRQQQ